MCKFRSAESILTSASSSLLCKPLGGDADEGEPPCSCREDEGEGFEPDANDVSGSTADVGWSRIRTVEKKDLTFSVEAGSAVWSVEEGLGCPLPGATSKWSFTRLFLSFGLVAKEGEGKSD